MEQLRILPGGKKRRAISVDPADSESAYPIQEWMIPGADIHGHSARIVSRVNPTLKNLISVVVQSGKFPWRTDAELIRWCLWYGMERIQEEMKNPDVTNTMSVLGGVVHVVRMQEAQLQFSKVLEKATEVIAGLVQQGAEPAARKILANIQEQVAEMDDPDWKERYQKELSTRFAKLMEEKNEDPD